jgi:hypothetical protein
MANTSSKPTPPPAKDTTPPGDTTPDRASTSTPSTEGGPVTVDTPPGTAVIVDSPQPDPDDVTAPRRPCVVKAEHHVGAAVPGSKVCSYHTMHYNNDGTRRDGTATKGAKQA